MIRQLLDILARVRADLPEELYEPVEPPAPPKAEAFTPFQGPLEKLPATRAEVYRVYGDPGVGKPDRAWERKGMVVARDLPGRWNGGKGRLYCHRLAEPYLREALRRSELVAPGHIQRLGCFAFRHQRHDPGLPLSYHSWGIAVDINPTQNRAWYRRDQWDRSRRRGPVPRPFEPGWSEFWPEGMPRDLVDVWKNVGWRWGGDWSSFVDPMHFELVD